MSDLQYAINELREAIDAQFAEPLPCSGNQASARAMRVVLAQWALTQTFGRYSA